VSTIQAAVSNGLSWPTVRVRPIHREPPFESLHPRPAPALWRYLPAVATGHDKPIAVSIPRVALRQIAITYGVCHDIVSTDLHARLSGNVGFG